MGTTWSELYYKIILMVGWRWNWKAWVVSKRGSQNRYRTYRDFAEEPWLFAVYVQFFQLKVWMHTLGVCVWCRCVSRKASSITSHPVPSAGTENLTSRRQCIGEAHSWAGAAAGGGGVRVIWPGWESQAKVEEWSQWALVSSPTWWQVVWHICLPALGTQSLWRSVALCRHVGEHRKYN